MVSAGGGSGQLQQWGGRRAQFVRADPAGLGDPHGAYVFGRCDRYRIPVDLF